MAGSMYHAAADTMTEGHCAAAMVAAMTRSLCRRRKVAALKQKATEMLESPPTSEYNDGWVDAPRGRGLRRHAVAAPQP